jgi:hypothetical protein
MPNRVLLNSSLEGSTPSGINANKAAKLREPPPVPKILTSSSARIPREFKTPNGVFLNSSLEGSIPAGINANKAAKL